MAPRSKIALLALVAVAGRALGQQPCSDVTGLYGIEGNEFTLKQTGCAITGTDIYGNPITGSVLFGTNVMLTISQPGGESTTIMGGYDGVAAINLLGTTTALRKLNCSRTWSGLWTSPGNASLMIAVNNSKCNGVLYSTNVLSGTQGIPVILSPMNATFVNFNGINATAVMTGPERITLLGANYTMSGTNPCYSNDDLNLSPMCFRDILNLSVSNGTFATMSSYFATGNGRWSTVHDNVCVSGSATQSQCPAACEWTTTTDGQGICSCRNQASCLAAGFAWVTLGFPFCRPGIADQLFTATQDCCASKTNFCAYMGQLPNFDTAPTPTFTTTQAPMPMPIPVPTPMPTPYYPGGNCKQLPSSQIRDLEMSTGRIVRRCGSGPTPMPTPNYMPSPAYWSPSPPYVPSPSLMGPPPSPSYSMPPPSPSYMPPTPSSKR